MKKILSTVLTIVLLAQTCVFAAPAAVDVVDASSEKAVPAEAFQSAELFADSGTCGKNQTWTLDDEGTLTIDGTGDMYDYAVKWIEIELSDTSRCLVDADKTYMEFIHYDGSYSLMEPTKTYEEVTLSDGSVCLIESGRAYEEIELSDGSVCMVPSGATLEEVMLSDGSYAVKEVVPWSGQQVEKIVISKNVTDISAGIYSNVPFEVDEENTAFTSDEYGVLYNKGKTILYSVPLDVVSYEIPDSVTEIGDYAFSMCENLEEITLSDALQIIGDSTFEWCISLESIKIPDSVTTIGDCAFSSCYSLADVTLGNGVTTVGEEAFAYCDRLLNIVIPDSVTTIGDGAFYECTELTSATIGNGVTTIGADAFSCCYSLASVTVGESVESIGDGAFYRCMLLTNITILSEDAEFGYGVFDECDRVTVYGYEGSTAETYAEESGIPFAVIEEETRTVVDSGECGENVTWTLYDDGVLEINGTGYMYSWAFPSEVPWYSLRKKIKSVVIGNGVTSIGNYAFSVCDSLASVTIGDSVTSIGGRAFYSCYNLTSITIDENNEYYSSDEFGVLYNKDRTTLIQYPIGNERTLFEIPDSVTSIGEDAFYDCDSLASITIPDSVTSIGDDAFRCCDSLASITVDENNEYYSSDEFGVLYNKDKTTLIQYPIGNERTLFEIPDSVTSIGSRAFYSCYNLTSITISDSVTSLGDSAFAYCDSLTSITISDSVTSLGNSAFAYCDSLTSITIPDSVTNIGNSAFDSCDSLTRITIPDSVTSIGDRAFYYCTSLTSVTIGNGVTSIGYSAFYSCDSLESITIPDSVTSIGGCAFFYCTSLTSVTIGNSVTSIGSRAFFGCDSLESITIPDSVTTIGKYAFDGCENLTIYGYEGSTAETYAEENDIPFVAIEEEPIPEAKATVALSHVTGRAGDTVSVIVSLRTDEIINTIGVSGITYNTDVLTFDGFTKYDAVEEITILGSYDDEEMTVAIALKEAQSFNGDLFAINFVINEDAADGENIVDVSSLIKLNNTEITVNNIAGSVTVVPEIAGDINHDNFIDMNDAVLVLRHSLFPEIYPVEYKGSLDFTKDGVVNRDDAILVLQHSLFPEIYPLG